MKYEVIEANGMNLLIKSDEENFRRELIAQGKSSGDILENVIYLQTFGGDFKFYFLNEDRSEIKLVLENVDDYAVCGEYLSFRRGVDYFAIKESNLAKISLGTWFEKGMFLNKTEAGVKFFHFADDELVEETYKSLCIIDDEVICEDFALSKDGRSQYSILEVSSDSWRFCPNISKVEGDKQYFEADDIKTLYARNDSSEFFVKVYEGKSLIRFSNAVLEQGENGIYSLYGVENCQMVLWGQGTEADWDDLHVILDKSCWNCDLDDSWILVNNPSIIEDEPEPEPEPESEPEPEVESEPESKPEFEHVCQKKWWQFWK